MMISFAAAGLLFAAASAPALQTERFLDDSLEDFANGDFTTATLTYDGKVAAPYERERLADVDASVVWDVAEHNGARYLATGHEGKLFRQEGASAPQLVHSFEESALYSVAAAKGEVYVGASPGGIVYRVTENGAEAFSKTGQQTIWDLLPTKKGMLVATGKEGQILQVSDDGTTETLVKIPDVQNVLDLAAIPGSDDVAVATQGKGLIIRVNPDGKVKVLLDPEQEEVRRVAVLEDGSIAGAVNGMRSPGEKLLQGKNGKGNGGQKPQPASFIARVYPDGFAEEWWTAPESPIHDFYVKDDGTMIVAAGSNGNLFIVTPDGSTNYGGMTWEQYVTRLAPGEGDGLYLGTGATAALYRMNATRRGEGVYESRVLDAKASARWGHLRVMTANGGALTVQTRSGNTAEADDSWSGWTEPAAPQENALEIGSPVSRFLQYRLNLPAKDGATVDMVRVFYARTNAAPTVTEVKVAPQQEKGKPPVTPAMVGRMEAAPHSAPQMLEISWKAEDPNSDHLLFNVYLKTVDGGEWMLLEEDLDQPSTIIPAGVLPEGAYRARVTARDYDDNAKDDGALGEGLSGVFLVDNRQPEVILLSVERRNAEEVFIRFRAEDRGSLVATAAWRADLDDWNRLAPEDSLMDEHSEIFSFTIKGENAREGRFATILVTDESGNTTVEKVSLVDKSSSNQKASGARR